MTLWSIEAGQSRSISPENITGEPGRGATATVGTGARAARELGPGWKISPSIEIQAGETAELAAISGSGMINHLWLTVHRRLWRTLILRIYWDDAADPAVEVPLGDFFCLGWCQYAHVNSLQVSTNPSGGLNAYWQMPFRRAARITLENLAHEFAIVYYQVDYELRDLPDSAAYLHAQWSRSNPVPRGDVHTLIDLPGARGHYVGTYLAWQANSSGWWGEGEVKFYLDQDREYPTICGTGTEDYFGGAWNFDVEGAGYTEFSTPYLGLPQVLRPDGLYASQQRFGMYRWHVVDPIRFTDGIRATVQALGWRPEQRYHQLQDDVASTSWLYLDTASGQSGPKFTESRVEVI